MNTRLRPRNYFLVVARASVFLLYFLGTQQISISMIHSKDEHTTLKWVLFLTQVSICIYGLCGFVFLVICCRMRSFGYNSKSWNEFEMKFFGATTIAFLLLGTIATVTLMDKFLYFGAFLFYGAYVSALIFVVVWRREQNIKTFVERVLHANSMSNSYVTEQNARDLYKLRECDKDFAIYRQSCSLSNDRLIANTVCHAEYYQFQKWLKTLSDVMENKIEVDVLHDLHKEMAKRAELYGLDSKHERRYQQLASLSHLIMPMELDENDKPLIRDTSFFLHNNRPDTTV